MAYLIALILSLICVSQTQVTNKSSTVLCHSQCNKFFNNGNTFSNEIDMAMNLTAIGFYSDSYTQVVDTFVHYSSAFKQKQLASMLAFKEVKRYRDRTITAYGASQINEYLSNTYPDGVCPLCTNLETENGGVPPYLNMFEEYVLAGSLNDELSSASFMLSMPISEFPLFQFARLLQPGVNVVGAIENHIYVCPNNAYNLIQLANCLYEQQLAMDMVNPLVETIISLNPSAPVNVVTGMEGDLMSGYANLVINKKYQEVMLLAYVNCLNNIYDVC